MKAQKPVRFGDLKVGDLFRYNAGAEAIDQKIEPEPNGYFKPYQCGCAAAEFNNHADTADQRRIDGRQIAMGHICDDKTVWVDVDEPDDITLVLVADPPIEEAGEATTAPTAGA